jgi:hypothetical protein
MESMEKGVELLGE